MTPVSRSDPVLEFVRSRQRFVHRCHGRKKPQPPLLAGASVGRLIEPCGGERSVSVPLLLPTSPIALVALIPSWDLFVSAKDLLIEWGR
jgi:hypothetical protein